MGYVEDTSPPARPPAPRKSLRGSFGLGAVACAVLSGDLQLLPTLVEKGAKLRCRALRLGEKSWENHGKIGEIMGKLPGKTGYES